MHPKYSVMKRRFKFDINLYSLKAYNNFLESKLCRWLTRFKLYMDSFDSPIGIYLWLSSPKDFDENEIKRLGSENLKSLAGKCKAHLFQYAKTHNNKTGRFIGILVTHEDFYYILMDDEGNKYYESCVGRLEFLKQ